MPRDIECPRCGKRVAYEGNPFRPFCSERCKLIDLGSWVSGTYRVPGAEEDKPEDESAEPTKPIEET